MANKNTSFDITNMLNNISREETTGKRAMIDYALLQKNPNNHYSLSNIDELADDIETYGLLSELLVKPMKGSKNSYVIISGHRRHMAIQKLVEERRIDQFTQIPCRILSADEDDTLSVLKLHVSNMSSRELTEHDKMTAISEYNRLIKEAKKKGIKIKGNTAEVISKTMGLGTTQVKKYIAVDKNAPEEVKEALKKGETTFEKAYESVKQETSKPSKKKLDNIVEDFDDSDKHLNLSCDNDNNISEPNNDDNISSGDIIENTLIFKNKAEREDFLKEPSYSKWNVVCNVPDLNLIIYKYHFKNNASVLVSEYTSCDYKGEIHKQTKYHLIIPDDADNPFSENSEYLAHNFKTYTLEGCGKSVIVEYMTKCRDSI